jgi:hypothetical protein
MIASFDKRLFFDSQRIYHAPRFFASSFAFVKYVFAIWTFLPPDSAQR